MLKTRILTAIIALPIVIAAIIFLPPVTFSVLVGLLILVGAWEWSQLAGIKTTSRRVLYVVSVMLGLLLFIFVAVKWFLLFAALIWVWVIAGILYYERGYASIAGFKNNIVRGIAGFFILIATWQSIIILKSYPGFGASWLIILLLIVFGADIGGYFVGRAFGSHALSPRVSPKKTWEGFFGGLIFSIAIAVIGGNYLVLNCRQYVCFLVLSFITILFSVIGDLGVSLQKRIVDVKDSGSFFPGHGGMLDRLDSIAAAAVIFACGALWLL